MINFFKKLGFKLQLALGAALGIIGVILYFFISANLKAKKTLEYQLKKIKTEMEIAKLEEDSEESLKKIEELSREEEKIRKKIKVIEETEFEGKEVSVEELDDFFKNRDL